FLVLRLAQRAALREAIAVDIPLPVLTRSGRWTALGIALSAAVLLTASTFDFRLGLPTFLVAIVTAGVVLFESTSPPGHCSNLSPGASCPWSRGSLFWS